MATIDELQTQMDAAVAVLDFEQASQLRDRIARIRNGADDIPDLDTSGLTRQQPGAMGLGTSQQRVTPPPGWVRPTKPDPMTRGTSRRGKRT